MIFRALFDLLAEKWTLVQRNDVLNIEENMKEKRGRKKATKQSNEKKKNTDKDATGACQLIPIGD